MEIMLLLWPVSGVVGHVILSSKMGAWRDADTYLMFIPAMFVGPFYLVGAIAEKRHR